MFQIGRLTKIKRNFDQIQLTIELKQTALGFEEKASEIVKFWTKKITKYLRVDYPFSKSAIFELKLFF